MTMADFPIGMETFNVTFGAALSMVLADDLTMEVDIRPQISATWKPDGSPIIAFNQKVTVAAGTQGMVTLPNPDQDGFVNANGDPVRGWTYQARAKFILNDRTVATAIKTFTAVEGDTIFDLDTLIPATSSSGQVVHIVDHWTEAIDAAQAAAQAAALGQDGAQAAQAAAETARDAAQGYANGASTAFSNADNAADAADTSARDAAGAASTATTALQTIEDMDVVAVVAHGSNGATARPPGPASVQWIGTAAPQNAINNDTWVEA